MNARPDPGLSLIVSLLATGQRLARDCERSPIAPIVGLMSPLTPTQSPSMSDLLQKLQWRYATKKMNPASRLNAQFISTVE